MFIRSENPIWFMVDLAGLPLNDEYYAFFLTNDLPYVPQAVFQDPNGITAWDNPLEFYPNGTLPDNLYFDPTLVYRIEIRHGNTQADPLIYLIQNYVPGTGESTVTIPDFVNTSNQIIDSQFQDLNFVDGYVITLAGTYNIAPNWNLILGGSGTMTLSQTLLSGADAKAGPINGNPPTALHLVYSGWSSVVLQQQFNRNGAIFRGGAVSMGANIRPAVTSLFSLQYIPSGGTDPAFVTRSLPGGVFTVLSSSFNLVQPITGNPNTGNAAFIDFNIVLPNNGTVDVTNVQFLGQTSPLSNINAATPDYQQTTYEMQVNQEFNYYKDSIINQSKSSLLAGWNFGLNPWQFTSPTPANVATNKYTADQTIIIQQAYVASAAGNNIEVGRSTFLTDHNYAIQVKAVTATNEFALLQWIDPATIRPYWGKVLSSMVTAFINTTNSTSLKFKLRLIYKAGLPNSTAQNDPIASWAANGDPVPAATYSLIVPPIDNVYTLTGVSNQFAFNSIPLPASTDANMTLGILIYTVSPMIQTGTADIAFFEDISLVPNEFALPTQAETFDEALRKCQYYYEKSYNLDIIPGSGAPTHTTVGVSSCLTSDASQNQMVGMDRTYKVTKRVTPTTTWYSPATGTSGNVANATTPGELTVSSTSYTGIENTGYPTVGSNPGNQQVVFGHWVADVRLG